VVKRLQNEQKNKNTKKTAYLILNTFLKPDYSKAKFWSNALKPMTPKFVEQLYFL